MIQKDFISETCNEKETLSIIKKNFLENNIILDPHTAIGVGVAEKLSFNDCVVLSTAHPCKFPDAINKELDILDENTPSSLKEIMTKEETFSVLENNFEDLNNYLNSEVLN